LNPKQLSIKRITNRSKLERQLKHYWMVNWFITEKYCSASYRNV